MERPTYKKPFQKQRCLIPADGFYEWKATPQGKLPYRFILKSKNLFAFAGLYDYWKDNGNITSFSIITVEPNKVVKPIHTRMPAILMPEDQNKWLEENDIDKLKGMLNPYPAELMEGYQVSKIVNSIKSDIPEMIKPVDTLSKFF